MSLTRRIGCFKILRLVQLGPSLAELSSHCAHPPRKGQMTGTFMLGILDTPRTHPQYVYRTLIASSRLVVEGPWEYPGRDQQTRKNGDQHHRPALMWLLSVLRYISSCWKPNFPSLSAISIISSPLSSMIGRIPPTYRFPSCYPNFRPVFSVSEGRSIESLLQLYVVVCWLAHLKHQLRQDD